MRRFSWVVLGLAVVLATASPSAATVASIAMTAPLQDHEEQSVNAALQTALEAAVKGAMAMGLRWVRMSHALVLEDAVAVQIVATDTDPNAGTGQDEQGPDTEPGLGADDTPQAEL
jgi:hypothetical protein